MAEKDPENKDISEDEKKEEKEKVSPEVSGSTESTSEWLMNVMKRSLGLADKKDYPEQLLETLDLAGVAKYINSGKCHKIVTMAGAGISTSAGIPDFRSPGTGLYDNLQKYDLPSPQAMFDIGFFKEHPEPFFQLAKELWPGIFKPTVCHYFVKLLAERGLLLRHYSQNIDTLERVAGIDGEKIVEAHGTFHTAHCTNPDCRKKYSKEWMKEKVFAEVTPTCEADDCVSLVKPDIVFFGEPLPKRFFQCTMNDMKECDLLIIMGTSLVVQPFASLTSRVPEKCPRLYINLEKASGSSDPMMALLGMGHGFRFDEEDNYRDVFAQGTCDDGCLELAKKLGWEKELNEMIEKGHKEIEDMIKAEKKHAEEIGAKAKKSESPGSKAIAADKSAKSDQKSDSITKSPSDKKAKSSTKEKASSEKEDSKEAEGNSSQGKEDVSEEDKTKSNTKL